MTILELDELTTFMVNRKILHLVYDGVTISLHESALFPKRQEASNEATQVDREIEPLYEETPQQRSRRQYAESLSADRGNS